MKIIHNEFATKLPETWEDRTMITMVAPFQPGGFATNIVVTKHPVGALESLEDFAEEQKKLMQESMPSFELLDFRATEINGSPACQQLHRFQTENGLVQQAQTFILANQIIYAVIGTAKVEDFNEHLQAFRDVVDNLEISQVANG